MPRRSCRHGLREGKRRHGRTHSIIERLRSLALEGVFMNRPSLMLLTVVCVLYHPFSKAENTAFPDAPPIDAAIVGIVDGHQVKNFREKS